jgi:hypothetical protein
MRREPSAAMKTFDAFILMLSFSWRPFYIV